MQIPEHCGDCRDRAATLSAAAIEDGLAALPCWHDAGGKIARSFLLPNFRKALAWINRVGMLAEQEGHHPDFHLTGWNRVELVLFTHSVGGLTLADFVLAKRIDALARADELD